jgi:molybdopterin molybdotransferase
LRPFPLDGAGILTSLVDSDGLIELAEDTADVAPGTRVEFLPFSELTS